MKPVPICFRIALLVTLMGAWGPNAFSHDSRFDGFSAGATGGIIFVDENGLINPVKSSFAIHVSLLKALGVSRVEGSIRHPYGPQLTIEPGYENGVQEASISVHDDRIDFSIQLLNPLPAPSGRATLFSATPTASIPLDLLLQDQVPAIRWNSFSAWDSEGNPVQANLAGEVMAGYNKNDPELYVSAQGFLKPVDLITVTHIADVSVGYWIMPRMEDNAFHFTNGSSKYIFRKGEFLPLRFQVWFTDNTFEEFYVEHPSAQVVLTSQSSAVGWEQYP